MYMSEDRFLSRPTQLVNDPLSLVYPFPTAAWVLLGIATILSIFMALIFTCVYRRCEIAKGELVHEKSQIFLDSFQAGLQVLDCYLQFCTNIRINFHPSYDYCKTTIENSAAGRLFIMLWVIFIMFTFLAYNSILLAALTRNRFSATIYHEADAFKSSAKIYAVVKNWWEAPSAVFAPGVKKSEDSKKV